MRAKPLVWIALILSAALSLEAQAQQPPAAPSPAAASRAPQEQRDGRAQAARDQEAKALAAYQITRRRALIQERADALHARLVELPRELEQASPGERAGVYSGALFMAVSIQDDLKRLSALHARRRERVQVRAVLATHKPAQRLVERLRGLRDAKDPRALPAANTLESLLSDAQALTRAARALTPP